MNPIITVPITRTQLHDLLRDTAIDLLAAERPELRRLESAIIHAEFVFPQAGPHSGGALIEFTLREPAHNDLPGQKTIFDGDGETPASAGQQPGDNGAAASVSPVAARPAAVRCTCAENGINIDGFVCGDIRGCPVHDPAARSGGRRRKGAAK